MLQAGGWRVEGVLAVTRAIGDKDLKRCVTAEPFIGEYVLECGDESLILASDGLWDVVNDATSVKLATDAARAVQDKLAPSTTREAAASLRAQVCNLRACGISTWIAQLVTTQPVSSQRDTSQRVTLAHVQ